jgi:hypothetical protein
LETPPQHPPELQSQSVVARNATVGQFDDRAEPWIRRCERQSAEAVGIVLGIRKGIYKTILDEKVIAIVAAIRCSERALCTDALFYFKTPLGILGGTELFNWPSV